MQQRELYAGRYRLGPELGRGGMGVVHLAHDEQLDRDVALKTMALSARADPVWAARFQREAKALASVRHPGVVTVYEYGESNGELYLAMELVEGGSLEQRLSGHRRLSPSRTAELATGIADALDALHRRGLVHRDIKPSNVLLSVPEERPVLCDFGLAKSAAAADGLTSTGEAVGTVHYMSPEQLTGDRVTSASDVYALGCLLFHCLVGRPPYTGSEVHAVADGHLRSPVPDVRAFVPDVPGAVQPVLERCLAKDPAGRWPTAGAAAHAFGAALRPHDTAVLPTSPVAWATDGEPEPPRAEPSRADGRTSPRRLAAAGAALVAVAGLVGAAVGFATGGAATTGTQDDVEQASGLDPAEQQLAVRLADDYGDCSPLDRAPGQVAKLNCDRTPDGIASLHAVQWEDSNAMDEWFRTSYVQAGSYTAAPCGDFDGGPQAKGTGHVSTRPDVGDIACYVNANGHAVMLWQVDDQALSLLAIRDDADAGSLFEWWQGARDSVLQTDG